MALEELCYVLDQITGQFTLKDLEEKAMALDPPIDMSAKKSAAGVAALASIGALKKVPVAFPHSRAAVYEKNLGEGLDFVTQLRLGRFKGLYNDYRSKAKPRSDRGMRRATREPEPEPEPEPVYEELDPIKFAQALGWEGFMTVFKHYIDHALAEAEARTEQAERIEADMRFMQGQKVQDERAAQAKINDLNEQLRAEREKVMNLQAEVSNAHSRVRREAEPRILYQRDVAPGGMQHGVNVGGSPSRDVVHRKPLTGHAPKVVVEWKKK